MVAAFVKAAPAVVALPAVIDFADVQGIVRFGHGKLTEACFLLLQVADRAAAQRWLQSAPVTSALTTDPPPETALQVAFTRQGLEALGVAPEIIEGFSDEFIAGMAGETSRSRRLGDFGANDPCGWTWGGSEDAVPHLALMVYARPRGLKAWEKAIKGAEWDAAFRVWRALRPRKRRRRAVRLSRRLSASRGWTGSRRSGAATRTTPTTPTSARSASFCSATPTSTGATPSAP